MKKSVVTDKMHRVDVEFPDKCPYCDKDFSFETTYYPVEWGKDYYIIANCIHCGGAVLSIYDCLTGSTIHTYPSKSIVSIPQEVRDLSPAACEIYEQAMEAKSTKLNHLVGPGVRMALEWLIWDYLINFKGIPQQEIENKKLARRLDYIQGDQYKAVCAKIIQLFGNDEIHIIKKYNIDTDEAIKALQILFDLIYSEIFIQNVNAKL
jgi:hypothetical protein|nr:MAG TPA: zinc-ribbon domain protein [Caudoviricetes sp.]